MPVSSDQYFAIIPEWVLDSGISPRAIHLYCILNRYANEKNRATPSRKKLADRLSCSRDTIDRAIKELTDIGALEVTHRKDATGDWTSSEYCLLVQQGPRTDAATPSRTDAGTGSRVDAAQNQSHIEPEISESEKTLARGRKRDTLFEIVAEVCQINWQRDLTKLARSQLNAAVSQLRALDVSLTEVERRAANFRATYPDAVLTPTALAKHWPQLERAPNRSSNDYVMDMVQRFARREVAGDGRSHAGSAEARRSLPPAQGW